MALSKAERKREIFLLIRSLSPITRKSLRNREAVSELVQDNWSRIQREIPGTKKDSIVQTILNLAKLDVFESEFKAKLVFPELFQPSPVRSLQHEKSEREAIQSESDALQNVLNAGETQPADLDEFENDDNCDVQQPIVHRDGPSVFPTYLTIESQHQLFNLTQKLLEESCFNFASKWVPQLLEQRGWTCALAVELNRWPSLLPAVWDQLPEKSTTARNAKDLQKALLGVVKIRHIAVHRLETHAKEIERLLVNGFDLARTLKDDTCATKMETLSTHLVAKVKDLELQKNLLESKYDEGIKEIDDQIEELQRRREEIRADLFRDDKTHTQTICAALTGSITDLERCDDTWLAATQSVASVEPSSTEDTVTEDLTNVNENEEAQ